MVIYGKNKIKVIVSEWQERCVIKQRKRKRESERVQKPCKEARRYY